MVMSSGAGKLVYLWKLRQLVCELVQGEGRALIGDVSLRANPEIKTLKFELFFGHESFVCVQPRLKLDVNVAGGFVNKKHIRRSTSYPDVNGQPR